MISIGPDSPGQSIHRDEWAFDFFPFPSDVHPQCNTIWAMTDFTEENGATRVIPGSQDWPVQLDHDVSETVPAEMTQGLVPALHGQGVPRRRREPLRRGADRAEPHLLRRVAAAGGEPISLVPTRGHRTLDDDLLKLMGYQIGAYALGYVDDVRDPLDALHGTTGAMGFGVEPNVPTG